jgi:hypothetical protein
MLPFRYPYRKELVTALRIEQAKEAFVGDRRT